MVALGGGWRDEMGKYEFGVWRLTKGEFFSPVVAEPPSPTKTALEQEFANLQLKDIKRLATLGVGGFGRVELVRLGFFLINSPFLISSLPSSRSASMATNRVRLP